MDQGLGLDEALAVDRIRRRDDEQRIVVRKRPHDGFSSDVDGPRRPVFDDKRLPEPLRDSAARQMRRYALVPTATMICVALVMVPASS